jgi:hypothetical protein
LEDSVEISLEHPYRLAVEADDDIEGPTAAEDERPVAVGVDRVVPRFADFRPALRLLGYG